MPRRRKRGGTRKKRGGAAIASGSYGCVFSPQLRCNSSSPYASLYDPKGVSKLMMKRHAEEEMQELKAVASVIKTIPNGGNYFVGFGPGEKIYNCKPAPLTGQDTVGISECNKIIRHTVGSGAVPLNSALTKFNIINGPYGGISLDNAWGIAVSGSPELGQASMSYFTNGFAAINNALQRLLVYGIVPMNKRGMLHNDIKDTNVLIGKGFHVSGSRRNDSIHRILEDMTPLESYDPNLVTARLIDWGLASKFNAKEIPERLLMGDLMGAWNNPITGILLNEQFTKTIQELYKGLMINKSLGQLARGYVMEQIANIIYTNVLKVVTRHPDFVGELLHNFNEPIPGGATADKKRCNVCSDMCVSQSLMIRYLAKALDAYIDKNGVFQSLKFFNEVYSKNADVYGFVMCYMPLVDSSYFSNHKVKHLSRNRLSNGVSRILMEYCFSDKYAASAIPIDKLVRDLLLLDEENPANSVGAKKLFKDALMVRPASKTKKAKAPGKAKTNVRTKTKANAKARSSSSKTKRRGPVFSWPEGKRCPKGSRRNKKDGKCHTT
jgi:serine/threonine protein kinase